ncbi:hypothetical protein RND71_014565 [Anisodus tanguticus]|uniref:Uncharacterized protein n=1 Tax=Anisodus tanguticus TaxID=243964 RepID=A0AAE1VNR9_9SOLA|nr:hypothetical protein RND71_014565 [Anisodus tanguticus]
MSALQLLSPDGSLFFALKILTTMASSMNDIHKPFLENNGPSALSPQLSIEHNFESNNELETVLLDTSLPLWNRVRLSMWIEMKLLFFLAAPAVMMYMINYLMSMSTQIFSGHLGNLELAAASLGNTGIQIFTYGLMPILIFLGESPEIASAAALFVYGLIPQIFAYAVNFPIQKFLQAQSIVTPSAYISAATLVLHLVISWVAVYKIGLGLLGASLILSLSWWIIVLGQFVYIVKSEKCKRTWNGFSWRAFSGLSDFFKLSAASAVMLCLEIWYFQILVLLVGLLENPELALDSLSICMTVSGWVFMILVGFNAPTRSVEATQGRLNNWDENKEPVLKE